MNRKRLGQNLPYAHPRIQRRKWILKHNLHPPPHPTQLAARIFSTARDLLAGEADGTRFRLIGVGVSALSAARGADFADLIDRRTAEAEQAMDRLRERFGRQAVIRGLAFENEDEGQTTDDG